MVKGMVTTREPEPIVFVGREEPLERQIVKCMGCALRTWVR